MATEMVNLMSAGLSSVASNEISGRKAALPQEETSDSQISGLQKSETDNALSVTQQVDMVVSKDENGSSRHFWDKQAQNLQELSDLKGWSVSFRVDDELNKTVIKVVDADTQKIIRQIPSEEMLSLSKRLQEFRDGDSDGDLSGLLFSSEI